MTSIHRQQTTQILILAFAGFIFNTTEFIPVGLLTAISAEFNITPADAGWMLTIYAWVVAGFSVPLIYVTRHMERKKLMSCVFVVFIFSHVFSYCAWSFSSLVASRIGVALSHALFWSMTANMAIRLAPKRKAFALSMIATGTSLAMILGVPIGRVIGQILSWRAAFGSIAIIALIILISLSRLLPSLPSTFHGSIKDIVLLFKNRLLVILYVIAFGMFVSHFTTYSYIEPLLKQAGHFSDNTTTLWLILFGIAAIIGSLSFGRLWRSTPVKIKLTGFILTVSLATTLLIPALHSSPLLFLVIILWGASRIMMVLSIQSIILTINEKGGDFVMAMFSSIVNVGIGSGALIGGQIIDQSEITNIGYASTVIGLAAFGLFLSILRNPKLN